MTLTKFLDPKNDVAFKKVFGSEEHKDILIHFINDILELKGNDQIEDVTFLSPIQDPDIASKKQSIVDVLCRDKNGVQIIVEMQVAPNKGFEKRAQYYASKAYSRQLNKGSGEDGQYANLKEVIFIAISNTIIFKDKKDYKSDHVILDKKTYEHDLRDFSFTFIELPKFKKDNISDLENIVEKWCYFFKYAEDTHEKELANLVNSDLVIEKAYEALNKFNWSEMELIAYDEEIKRIMDNRAAMDYQIDLATEKGMKKGMEQGIEQGIEKGKKEERIAIVTEMLAEGDSLEKISRITKLSLEQIKKIKLNN